MYVKDFYYMANISDKKLTTKSILMLANYLKELNSDVINYTIQSNIEPLDGYKYKGDFFSLLNVLDVPPFMHIPTLWLNELKSSEDYNGGVYGVKLYNTDVVDEIKLFLERINDNSI